MRTTTAAAIILTVVASAVAPGVSTGAVASNSAYVVPEEPDVRVDVYVSASAQGDTEHVTAVSDEIRGALSDAVPGAAVSVGPAGVVSVPDDEDGSARETMEWFCSAVDRDGADAVLLLVPDSYRSDWEYGGYGKPGCGVALGVERMDDDRYAVLALHETGHALGLGHAHASASGTTVMDHDAVYSPTFEWTEYSKQTLAGRYAPA